LLFGFLVSSSPTRRPNRALRPGPVRIFIVEAALGFSLSDFSCFLSRQRAVTGPSPGSIFVRVLAFVPVRPLPKAPRPFLILGEARRRPSGWDLESPASFVLPEHRTTGCRFILRALGFGAAGWLSVFSFSACVFFRFAFSSASLPQRTAVRFFFSVRHGGPSLSR
jgi:hypothetical protein